MKSIEILDFISFSLAGSYKHILAHLDVYAFSSIYFTYPAVQDYTSEYNLYTQARDIKIVQHYNKKQILKTKIKIISEYI